MTANRRAISKCTLLSFPLAVCQDLDISALARTDCSLHIKGKKSQDRFYSGHQITLPIQRSVNTF